MSPVIIIAQLTANSSTQSCFSQTDDCRWLVFIEKYTLVSAEKKILSHVKEDIYIHFSSMIYAKIFKVKACHVIKQQICNYDESVAISE